MVDENPQEETQPDQESPERPAPLKMLGTIKSVKDVIKHISRDYQDVDRDMEVTIKFSNVTERQLRRVQRHHLLERNIEASISPLQYSMDVGEDPVDDLGQDQQAPPEFGGYLPQEWGHCEKHESDYERECAFCAQDNAA